MAQKDQKQAEVLGLAVGALTLDRFTPDSVSEFLSAVSAVVQEKIAPQAGDSPWLPSRNPDHKGALTAPSNDDRGPFTFAALTHTAVTRALVSADPANLRDIATVMEVAATSRNQMLRLSMLRVAVRWNYAMVLTVEKMVDHRKIRIPLGDLLIEEPDATPLPTVRRNTSLPVTSVASSGDDLFVVDDQGHRIPAGRPTPAPEPEAPAAIQQEVSVPKPEPEVAPTPAPQPAPTPLVESLDEPEETPAPVEEAKPTSRQKQETTREPAQQKTPTHQKKQPSPARSYDHDWDETSSNQSGYSSVATILDTEKPSPNTVETQIIPTITNLTGVDDHDDPF